MKTNSVVRGLLLTISLIAMCALALAQDKLSDEEKAKKAAASRAIGGPGPEHKQLEALVGVWDHEVKVWPAPGAPKPITIKGRSENRMILGGRFLVSESKGGTGGMAIETMSIYGFDRRSKRFTVVAYDSTGTYYVSAAGAFNEQEKAIVMSGEDYDPVFGGTQTYNMILRTVSPDSYVVEVVFTDPVHTQGKGPYKAVEITNTRVK